MQTGKLRYPYHNRAMQAKYNIIKITIQQTLLKGHDHSTGISMNVQPMYFGESAPKHLRGAISLSSAVFTAFGVVLGQVVGLRFVHRAAYNC